MYELSDELQNDVRLKKISRKCQNCIDKHPCAKVFGTIAQIIDKYNVRSCLILLDFSIFLKIFLGL